MKLNIYESLYLYGSNTNFIFKITNNVTTLFDIDSEEIKSPGKE